MTPEGDFLAHICDQSDIFGVVIRGHFECFRMDSKTIPSNNMCDLEYIFLGGLKYLGSFRPIFLP